MSLDARVTLARPDLAAASLEGVVRAARFAEPTAMRVVVPMVPVRAAPSRAAEQVDQLLFGETFAVLDERGGFVWGQARRDGYVGWVQTDALTVERRAPTHWVSVARAFAFEAASIKSPAAGPFGLGALMTIVEETATLAHAAGAGWIAQMQLMPIGRSLADPATVATGFVGAPYLWGGRDGVGLDCSGLIQQALNACGRFCPRDADQQATLGAPADPGDLRRGDLVCWRGHIGIMLDAGRLIHANAHHMRVAVEPLAGAVARIAAAGGGEPTAYRRLWPPCPGRRARAI